MSELEFLTEKDLAYFQDLEKQGKAVIISISDEELLSLDISSLLNNPNGKEEIDPDELAKWIEQHKSEFRSQYEKNKEISDNNKRIQKQIDDSLNDNAGGMQMQQNIARQNAENNYTGISGSNLASIFMKMQEMNLTEDQSGIVMDAIAHDLDEDLIMYILNASKNGTDAMLKLHDIFVNQGN